MDYAQLRPLLSLEFEKRVVEADVFKNQESRSCELCYETIPGDQFGLWLKFEVLGMHVCVDRPACRKRHNKREQTRRQLVAKTVTPIAKEEQCQIGKEE